MNYNLGERVKPKRHGLPKPLLFAIAVIVVLMLGYYFAMGHVGFSHHFLPSNK